MSPIVLSQPPAPARTVGTTFTDAESGCLDVATTLTLSAVRMATDDNGDGTASTVGINPTIGTDPNC